MKEPWNFIFRTCQRLLRGRRAGVTFTKEVNCELSKDYTEVTVTFPTDPPATIKLDADGVDGYLKSFSVVRACMDPEYPRDFPSGQVVDAVPDPLWVAGADVMFGDSLIHVRHPLFGWLHFSFTKDEASNLGRFFQSQAEAPPESPPEKTN